MNCDNTGEEGERAGNLFPAEAGFLFLPRRVVGDDKSVHFSLLGTRVED